MFRHQYHHYLTPGLLKLGEEGIQFIKEFLRPQFVIRCFAIARIVVAVMQWQQVVEGGGALTLVIRFGLHPAIQYSGVVVNRRAIKGEQDWRKAGLVHQWYLHPAVIADLFQKTAKFTVVIHHQLLRKAQFCEVIKQIALRSGLLVKVGMRGLPAAGAQQTNRCRAAVSRGGVEMFKHHIEMRPQRVRH
ncbi:hypothetical protein ACUY4R_004088 [Kosakonia sp. BK9b]